MCGIAGFTGKNRRIWDSVNTIVHRGPDHQGCYESEYACIGATRLKIIDLEGGDQPIISEDGDVVIAFNGEIYNHEEIRHELEQLGHCFVSRTDTETILEAFRQWDTACFSKLRGMFAIALWTESKRRLILARDRVGIKPLYISRVGPDIIFGSELKTLFAHPDVERKLNLAGLDCYMALNYVPSPLTLVEGIEKLAPGTWMEWKDGSIRTECFWKLPSGDVLPWTEEAAAEQLDDLLRKSVAEHLLADVPLGLWLSGGLDSSTVLHYAAAASSRPIRTFSISFEGRTFDDGGYSQQVAAHYGTRHEQLNLTEDFGLREAIEEFSYFSDDPNADAGALPVWFLSKMTRSKVTVALSGEGADELFGGYLTYRADALSKRARLATRPILSLASEAARALLPASDDKISFEYKVKRFLEGSLMPFERAHVYWNGTFTDSGKQELMNVPLSPGLAPLLRPLERAGNQLKSFLWFDQKYYMADDILAKVDRMSMAHSLEVRPPFLDHRLIEFSASLPPQMLMQGANQKVILRNLMAGKLPKNILQRKKIGFDIPAHEWLRGPLKAFMREVLEEGMSSYPATFSRKGIEACIEQHLERKQNLGYHLWGLMILFMWMKRWQVRDN